MTANVGIAERADRLVVVLLATGLVGWFLPEVVLGRGARPARPRQPRHRGAADARGAPPGPGPRVRVLPGSVTDTLTIAGFRVGLGRRAPDAGTRRLRAVRPDRRRHRRPRRGGPDAVQLRQGAPRPRRRRARRPGARRDAPLPALLLRGLPPAGPSAPTTCSTGCGSRATARCARSSTAAARSSPSSATSATGTSPAPGAPPHLGPVTTVAERLKPEEVFEEFLAFRESLGMTILPLTGGVNPFPALREAARRPGIIPLLADRDLTASGVEVELCGHAARMAPGPAALALAEKRPLHPVSIRHERRGPRAGASSSPSTRPSTCPTSGTTRERATAMTQACADVLGAAITRAHRRLAHAAAGLPRRPRPRPRSPAATGDAGAAPRP